MRGRHVDAYSAYKRVATKDAYDREEESSGASGLLFTNCIVFYFCYVWTLGLGIYIALVSSLFRLGFEVHIKSLYSVVFNNMIQKSAQMHM